MTAVYETLERPLVPTLVAMEERGIAIDRQILSRLSGEFAQRMAALEDEIQKLAGEPFNLGSPKQLGDILFGKMNLPGGKKTASGQWGTGAGVLEDLAEQGHELPARILDWRQLAKLKSTYTDALPNFVHPQTDRVHTSFRTGCDNDREAVVLRAQYPEHSCSQRAGPEDQDGLRRVAGPQADLGGLQPDRAACAGAYRRYPPN